MSDSGLAARIQQQVKVVEGGNPSIRAYNESEVERLLDKLAFSDLSDEQLITIHYTLAEAAGEKSLGSPPLLKLLTGAAQTPGADRPLTTG